MKNLYLLLYLISISFSLQAQQNDPDNWQYFISPEKVNCHAESADYIWLGTNGGLVTFDKNTQEMELLSMSNSNLPSNTIESIQIDADGNTWIGTYDYILAMKQGDDWITKEVPFDPAVITIEPRLHDFEFDADGSIWVATNNGLWHHQDNDWEVYNGPAGNMPGPDFSNSFFWAVEELNGQVFFASNKLFRKDGNNIINLSDTFPDIFFYDDAHICTSTEKVFVSNDFGMIAAFENNNTVITSFNTNPFPINTLHKMDVDPMGNLYVIFSSGEKYLLDDNGWTLQFDSYTTVMDPTVFINKYYFIDDNDKDWVTENIKLFRYQNNTITRTSLSDLPMTHNSYKRMAPLSDGSIYIWETGNHAVYYHPVDGWSDLLHPDSINGEKVYLYEPTIDEQDRAWFSTNVGLLLYDGNTWEAITNLNSDYPYLSAGLIATGPNEVLYVQALPLEIAYFDGQNWSTIITLNSGFLEGQTKNMAVAPNGDLWITRDHTVQRFDGIEWTNFNDQNADLPDYIGFHNIDFAANGDVWLAAGSQGISHYNGTEWVTYSVADGIYMAQGVAIAPDGKVWVSTYQDIATFDGNNWSFMNTDNSLLLNNTVEKIYAATDGSIWMNSAGEGIHVYNENGFLTTGITAELLKSALTIYPNPATDVITFDLPFSENKAQLFDLIHSNGQLISTGVLHNGSLNIQSLSSGLYFVLIHSEEGIRVGKFVVK